METTRQNERSNEQQARPVVAANVPELGSANYYHPPANATSNYTTTTDPNLDSSQQQQQQQQPASSAANNNNSSQPQQQQANRQAKISHRSQSSPSALTTHKFGLRPTPSPPRLVIDHNTGDIVESYPDQRPVYLRTYQPIVDVHGHHHHHQQQPPPPITYYEDDEQLGDDNLREQQQQAMEAQRDIYIQPTHSSYLLNNKRAPNSNYLAHNQLQQQQQQPYNIAANSSPNRPTGQHSGSKAQKQAALAPNQQPAPRAIGGEQPAIRVTGCKNNNNNSNSNKEQQQPRYRLPAIEDFKLYKLNYNLNILLVLLLSSYIIYLLLVPLSFDCARFRPTYAYLSLITCHVNLIAIVAFTLVWYCNSVTRAMYANLSSSAFIISIYTILVAINLSLAIVFFFINTCHYQKIISTPLISATAGGPTTSPILLLGGGAVAADLSPLAAGQEVAPFEYQQLNSHVPILSIDQDGLDLSLLKELTTVAGRQPPIEDQHQRQHQQYGHQEEEAGVLLVAPDMSPIEAAWEFTKEQLANFRRDFKRFLLAYDLKFIGALHVIVAICFQYLAIRVAVVRSHYCSPVGVLFCPV